MSVVRIEWTEDKVSRVETGREEDMVSLIAYLDALKIKHKVSKVTLEKAGDVE